ncbi:BLUF domain-containing protein [Marixanthomonas ophiurae]|uniref:BLUF domain-containing protein n=1 Tax=Marixanthomonas ophiurae TaxID=387659 RepID=A0A3E1QCI7_9FLAO|nr:BLUF domain-containing protein [Marixanthomonas ophiurae]RFN59806.1 BLUF domain-containing protein [Marixanthomonas ophiurae]
MTYTICYVSSASRELENNELENLFYEVQTNNDDADITGVLLYYYGNFLQVLEGEKDILLDLFESIKKDKRHKNIITIFNKQNEHRIFEGYKSGFSIVKTKSDLKNLKEYLNKTKDTTPFSTSVLGLLEPFLI